VYFPRWQVRILARGMRFCRYPTRGVGAHGIWKNRKGNTIHKVDAVFAGWFSNVNRTPFELRELTFDFFAFGEVVDSIDRQAMDPIFGEMDTIQKVRVELSLCVAKRHDPHGKFCPGGVSSG